MMGFWFYVKIYFASLAAFLVLDMTWLGWIARNFYRQHLEHLLAARTNWAAAILFYLLFVLGLLIIAIIPGLQTGSLGKTLLLGALFGFFTYMTYDLTNLATLKNWPVILSLVDIAWGVALAISVSAVGFWVGKAL
jgi:uncharacterized membrane protein